MLHFFHGKLERYGSTALLKNKDRGIQTFYAGGKQEGDFYLYPHLDDNKKTVVYFAFDSMQQKQLFEDLLKVSGVGSKTAFLISQYSQEEINLALKNMDVKFFQAIPGIGPKSAKKILLELKGNFDLDQVSALDVDQKLFKDIVKSLKGFGYDADRVKSILTKYEGKISKENMAEVIKWVISQI
ncbi:MAG: helix-hairpin-helix domain-containing protein [Candidatus Absconditabacteria bacterium]|nr:helix-hairpin-helix domain-containing protein [Candidatus Absconditabacteria bacterium]MDD3868107.1 helix-hairpin-helix domain-containing protein [Candidatus Absconditabacteria bacterium]MDD4714355.1 helix-hairpin-helix domain-containing protein [Candidatus Absconditabacteria bacterium]